MFNDEDALLRLIGRQILHQQVHFVLYMNRWCSQPKDHMFLWFQVQMFQGAVAVKVEHYSQRGKDTQFDM